MSGLRPYQIEAVAAVRRHWAGDDPRGPLLVLATGTGKTRTACALIEEERGRVVVLAHREELLDQFAGALPKGVAGIVQGSRNVPHRRVTCASVDTLRNPARVAAILEHGHPTLVVVDEAHHSPSATHTQAIDAFPGARLLGLTATPDREDGADLGERWEIVYSYGITDAIRAGYLVRPFAAVVPVPGLDPRSLDDLDDEAAGEALIHAHVVEHTVSALLDRHEGRELPEGTARQGLTGRNRPTLVFTASVRQAELTAAALTEAGIVARCVTGKTPKSDRRRLLRAYTDGRVQCLVNPAVLTEGTDLPATSCVVIARPARSWALTVQMIGRALRLHPQKADALILDLAGATERHSIVAAPVLLGKEPCEHAWEPRKKGGAECSKCGERVACAVLTGPHSYDTATGLCTACDAPQCPESPTHRHLPVPMADDPLRRECCFCGLTFSGPSLLSSSGPPPKVPPDAWLTVEEGVWALDIGGRGLLFVTRASGPTRELHWLPKGARSLRALTPSGPVSQGEARLLAGDLTRRAARFQDRGPVRPGTQRYAEKARRSIEGASTEGEARRAMTTAWARERWAAVAPERAEAAK